MQLRSPVTSRFWRHRTATPATCTRGESVGCRINNHGATGLHIEPTDRHSCSENYVENMEEERCTRLDTHVRLLLKEGLGTGGNLRNVREDGWDHMSGNSAGVYDA
jgi:hypothetical protein